MMNNFYNDFDFACLERQRLDEIRTPFQKDRDRIIYTSAFRRLQAKTQVFISGEYDFYRTRLTHSLEVAQIGRSICHYLQHESDFLDVDFYIDTDLVEAVCLSHDLGHPPFGHAGEKSLHGLMTAFGGFEGNAQTLRIISEIIYSDTVNRKGMNPTRAFLDGIIKYKSLFSTLVNPSNHFLYDDQKGYLDFIFSDRVFPEDKNRDTFRSIECQVMDWADDTAYSINDIVDGISAGFLTLENIERWGQDQDLNRDQSEHLINISRFIRENRVSRAFAFQIGEFIRACHLEKWQNFMSDLSNRYSYKLCIDPEIQQRCKMYKKLSYDLVFTSPQIYQLEHKEDRILRELFNIYFDNYCNKTSTRRVLLPSVYEKILSELSDKGQIARTICDYISAMSDGFAIRTYKRLMDPDYGSIIDFV